MEEGIRAVVLGWQKSDKASVINSILGKGVESGKHFVRSVKRDGEVNGRKISLINTPCWWEVFGLRDSPEIVKQELVCSVFLCPPGPHVFLLVINLSLTFTKENRLSIKKHLSLFGERIWRHTIVIFTRVDSLKDKPIEQHIQNQADLQQILQRCGGRFHLFDTENTRAGVQELIHTIDDVVKANNGQHFNTNDEELLEMKRKRRENEERAKIKQKSLQDKRKLLKEINAVVRSSELRIVLLGWVLSGKSSAGKNIFNNVTFKTEGTKKCPKYSGVVNGRYLTVLDTPGWWKYFAPKFNPKFAQATILKNVGESQHMQFPHAMILVIPIDTSFTYDQKRIIEEYMGVLGEDVWKHTIILFTWGDRFPDVSVEEHIESEGAALQWLVEKCKNRYHVFDNMNRKNRDQVSELLQKIDEMVAENSLFFLRNPSAEDVNLPVSDLQQDEEMNVNTDQLLQLMYEELTSRFQEIKKNPSEMDPSDIAEAKSEGSMEQGIDLSAEDKLKEKIKREVRRLEAIFMDGSLNVQNPEASHDNVMSVKEKVSGWFQRFEKCSTSDTSGFDSISECTDTAEDPQNPDTPDNTSRLQSEYAACL